jgi:hypothetical protein
VNVVDLPAHNNPSVNSESESSSQHATVGHANLINIIEIVLSPHGVNQEIHAWLWLALRESG